MAKIAPYFAIQELDNNGDPLAGGKIYTYEAGTTTNKATYNSSDESSANANPVVLDSAGRADIWLASGAYKFVIKDSADNTIKTIDNIVGEASNVFGSDVVEVATNTTITTANKNNFLNCTTTLTLTLLPASTAEEGFVFIAKNDSDGLVTLDPDGSETIDGSATLVLNPQAWSIIVCDGTNWKTLTDNDAKNNLNASVAPTTGDDSDDGYGVNSRWLDTTADKAYVCLDSTVGSAVWVETTLESSDLGSSATKDFIDDDTFATASDSTTASSESIKAYVDNSLIFSEEFTSAEQTITGGGSLTIAHGLSSTPKLAQAILVCKVANLNYSVDDEVLVNIHQQGNGDVGQAIVLDATNINVRYGTSNYDLLNKTTGTRTNITTSSWRLKIRVWA